MSNLIPVEYQNRILATAQLTDAYATDTGIISKNFNRNKDHYGSMDPG